MSSSPATETIRTTAMIAALSLAAGGCGLAPVTGVPGDATVVPDDRVETLLEESYGGLDERRRQVVRDSAAWADVWRQLYESRSPVPERPTVDFGRSMVIVAAMGSRPTGGYGIGVESVHLDGETLYVVLRETSPGDGCMVTQALTAPTTAVRVPRVDGDVEFVEKETVRDCS